MVEKNNRTAGWRSDDEFLRRMLGGNFSNRDLPVMSPSVGIPTPANLDRAGAETRNADNGSGTENGNENGCCRYPSLAMVYAPEQKWKNLTEPAKALKEGTLFCALVKPFEGRSVYHGKGKGGEK